MALKYLTSACKLSDEGGSVDFIGSVHTHINLDLAPDGVVITLPRTYAWNSISVYPEGGASFTVEQTLSSPEEIGSGRGHWLQLEDFQSKTEAIFYMWEWPIMALRIRGSGKVHFDLASKQF